MNWYRITRRIPGTQTRSSRDGAVKMREIVGYVEAESVTEALEIAHEEYGSDEDVGRLFASKIQCLPDEDIWPDYNEEQRLARQLWREQAMFPSLVLDGE